MDKDDVKFRKTALVVAWMDVVLTTIGIFMVLAYAYLLASEASVRITSGKLAVNRETNEIMEALLTMWRRAGFISCVAAIQLCIAFVLTRASKSGRDPYDAQEKSVIWLYGNFGFFLIWFICALVAGSYIVAYIWLVIRIIFFYIVFSFIVELSIAISLGWRPKPKSQSEKPTQNTMKV